MAPTGDSESVPRWRKQYPSYPSQPGIYILDVNELQFKDSWSNTFLMCHLRDLTFPQIFRMSICYFFSFLLWWDMIWSYFRMTYILKPLKKKKCRIENGALLMLTVLKPLQLWSNSTLTQDWITDNYPGQERDTNLCFAWLFLLSF